MSQMMDEDDFGALFEEDNTKPRKRVSIGDKVSGTVMFLGSSSATIDLGGGLDALLDLADDEAALARYRSEGISVVRTAERATD